MSAIPSSTTFIKTVIENVSTKEEKCIHDKVMKYLPCLEVGTLLEMTDVINNILLKKLKANGTKEITKPLDISATKMKKESVAELMTNPIQQVEEQKLQKKYEYTICTEENPQIEEIGFILNYVGTPCRISKLTSDIIDGKWNGKFIAETDTDHVKVEIQLVKGFGSFIDYVVYDHLNPDEEKSTPILLVESTKTCDAESRNTTIYQRLIKFVVARKRFPDTPCIMFYNTEQYTNTSTNFFAKRLLQTLSIKAYDKTNKDLLKDSLPFITIDELIKEKEMIKTKSHNVSVKIQCNGDHDYYISAKLSKGAHDTICHDPNKGMITGLATVIHKLDKDARFRITDHHVAVEKIRKQEDKFWYANSAYDLRLDGSSLSSMGVKCPTKYWIKDTESEKAATINYHRHMEKLGWLTVFHNHSSSAKSYFIGEKGTEEAVPKITIPDVVMVNKEERYIHICEGKIWKDRLKGVEQLDHLSDFKHYTQERYPGYTIILGLCLYVRSLSEIDAKKKLKYPVLFAMDSEGNIQY